MTLRIDNTNSPVLPGDPIVANGEGFQGLNYNAKEGIGGNSYYPWTWTRWGKYLITIEDGPYTEANLIFFNLETRIVEATIPSAIWFPYGDLGFKPALNIDPYDNKLSILARQYVVSVFPIYICKSYYASPEEQLQDISGWNHQYLKDSGSTLAINSDSFIFNGEVFSLRTDLTNIILIKGCMEATGWDSGHAAISGYRDGMFYVFKGQLYYTATLTSRGRVLLRLTDPVTNTWEEAHTYTETSSTYDVADMYFFGDAYIYYAKTSGTFPNEIVEFFRSPDGNTWELLTTAPYESNYVFGAPGDIIYTNRTTSVYRIVRFNNGEWEQVGENVTPDDFANRACPRAFTYAGYAWVGTQSLDPVMIAVSNGGAWTLDGETLVPISYSTTKVVLPTEGFSEGLKLLTVRAGLLMESTYIIISGLLPLPSPTPSPSMEGDIKFQYFLPNGNTDISVANDGFSLTRDVGFETAVLISLFSNRRALPGETLPDPSLGKGGWWANELIDGDIGSHIWLLMRSTISQDTVTNLRRYNEEGLKWMVEDGIASYIEAEVIRAGLYQLNTAVKIVKLSGEEVFFKYFLNWQNQTYGGI